MKQPMEILRGLREDRDLKQYVIAELIGTSQQQYSKYETGVTELPLHAFAILADYYKVSADYILGINDCKQSFDALNRRITPDCTVGALVANVLSLNKYGRNAVVEYIGLQKMKEEADKKKKPRKNGGCPPK